MKPIKKAGRNVINKIAARPKMVKLKNGIRLWATGNMAWSFQDGHYYEVNVEHWLRKLSEGLEETVFYDIGANLGYYSILLSRRAKRVYSFEPGKRTKRSLKLNIRLNRRQNITVLGYGLSDSNRQAKLNIYSSIGNNSLFMRDLPPDHSLRLRRVEAIELRTLDKLVKEQQLIPPTLMKIDVEGGELAALKGGLKIIRSAKPVIVFEYSQTTSKDAGYQREDLTRLLQPLGYTFYGLTTDPNNLKTYELKPNTKVAIDNVIAVPSNNKKIVKLVAGR